MIVLTFEVNEEKVDKPLVYHTHQSSIFDNPSLLAGLLYWAPRGHENQLALLKLSLFYVDTFILAHAGLTFNDYMAESADYMNWIPARSIWFD